MKGLDIGPRDKPVEGFDTLDRDPQWGAEHIARWGFDDLPLAHDTYDIVYASHVLQFIPWQRTEAALKEAWRILKPGGRIEIWVPNLDYILENRACSEVGDPDDDLPEPQDLTKQPVYWFLAKMFGLGPHHVAAFNSRHLGDCLLQAGFAGIRQVTEPRGFDHGSISLGMVGTKPEPVEI